MNPLAIITGASRGIGRGIAIGLATEGYDLVINYASSPEKAEEAKNECYAAAEASGKSIKIQAIKANIGVANERENLIQQARDNFGKLDLLVNNAGITSIGRADLLEVLAVLADRCSVFQILDFARFGEASLRTCVSTLSGCPASGVGPAAIFEDGLVPFVFVGRITVTRAGGWWLRLPAGH